MRAASPRVPETSPSQLRFPAEAEKKRRGGGSDREVLKVSKVRTS